jgi:protease PrsW
MASRGPDNGQPVEPTDPVKRAHYLIALGIGAIGGFIAAFGEALYLGVAAATLLISESLFVFAITAAIAPLVEESTKPFGLFLLKEDEKLRFEPQTWALLGSLAGIGFGFAENVVYAISAYRFGLEASIALLLMRGLLTAPLHGITTTCTGFGIGLWQKSGSPRPLFILLTLAMIIHGSFNLLVSLL